MGSRDAQEGLPGAALWAPDTGQDYKGDPERSSVKIPWSLEGIALPVFRSAGPLSLERAGRRLPPQECRHLTPLSQRLEGGTHGNPLCCCCFSGARLGDR